LYHKVSLNTHTGLISLVYLISGQHLVLKRYKVDENTLMMNFAYELKSGFFQALLDGLGGNKILKTLELRGNNIQSNMICPLGAFLRTNNKLKK